MSYFLFAYGSLTPEVLSQRLGRTHFPHCSAFLSNSQIVFQGHAPRYQGMAVANILPCHRGIVRGLVYRLTLPDMTLLDRAQGEGVASVRVGALVSGHSGRPRLLANMYLRRHVEEPNDPGDVYMKHHQRLHQWIRHYDARGDTTKGVSPL
jgi:hypothetical protein